MATLPIMDFLAERLTEFDSTFEMRPGTAFHSLFVKPTALIVQPLRDEANEIQTNQSLKRILDLEDPDAYPEAAVDETLQNLYVFRRQGSRSGGTVRVLYTDPKDINVIAASLQFTNTDGLVYVNRNNIVFSAQDMANQVDGDFFYIDIAVEAELEGTEYDTPENGIIATSDVDAIRVFNPSPISGGADRETNTQVINRAQRSIGERSINTGKGFNAVMFENFINQLTELQPIGFQDPEMMRDIVFNFHIGGRVDGYVKTPQVLEGFFDVTGLNIDITRQLPTATNLVLNGTTQTSLGFQNIDTTNNPVRAFDTKEFDQEAVFYSYVNLASGVDLSTGEFIGVSIDNGPYTNIKISGANPSTTQVGEIVNRINAATKLRVATIAVNPIIVSRRSTAHTRADNQNIIKDPTPRIFKNVFVGDSVVIQVGTNSGVYTVQSVISENELALTTNIPDEENEINYRISRTGTFIKLTSPTKGLGSSVMIGSPVAGSDGLNLAIGLLSSPTPYTFEGRGRVEYQEGIDFAVDLTEGNVVRLIGTTIVPATSSGEVDKDIFFEDPSVDVFINVEAGDILTIIDATDDDYERDYRILEKVNNNRLRVDAFIPISETNIDYRITRTGIKDGDLVFFTFDFNPLSIDIGDQVQLDQFGRIKGIRPNREDQTITDLALLYITSVELIDPVSGEPIGVTLEGRSGFGRGPYGQGGFGRGALSEWRHIVNKPELRFSVLEDSFIDIATAYLGQSFRVNYRYVPEIRSFQTLVSSDSERILDADTVIKHFLPAVVDGTIEYTTNPNNPNTPTREEVLAAVNSFINNRPAGSALDVSDLTDLVYSLIDPTRTANVKVKLPVQLTATIYNTDGSLTIVTSSDSLEVPSPEIPAFTTRPLSPRITHWIAGTITLIENRLTTGGI